MALPGGPLEICFSFDTTISMTHYVDQVKAQLNNMVQKLQADIPGIRIGLFAHGDYIYEEVKHKTPYDLITMDFTDNVVGLCDFIQKAEPTRGYDWCECYEYVFSEARKRLSWSPHTNKVFVLIGDAQPHDVDDKNNIYGINWVAEVDCLVKEGVTMYGIYCKTGKSNDEDEYFFRDLSKRGGGSFLKIEEFEDIFDTLMAICYREQGEDALQSYVHEVKGRQTGPSTDVKNAFTTLKKSASNASSASGIELFVPKQKHRKRTTLKPPAGKTQTVKRTRKVKQGAKKPIPRVVKPRVSLKTRKQSQPADSKATKANNVKAVTNAPTKQKRIEKELIKLRREMVPETNFLLRELSWSAWKPAFCRDCSKNNSNWRKREKGVGYINANLFKKDSSKQRVLYELSVRSKVGRRKIVVARNSGNARAFSAGMEVKFGNQPLRSRLDNVLKKDCVVFVRRLILGRSNACKNAPSDLDMYSYLWDSDCHREFVKDDISM